MLGIVTFYVSFVLKIGPKMMASRKPFDLKPLLVVYNLSMILLSLYIVVMVSRRINLVYKEKKKIFGQPNAHVRHRDLLCLLCAQNWAQNDGLTQTLQSETTPCGLKLPHDTAKSVHCRDGKL